MPETQALLLQGKRVLLGIGGGIAAYRIAELARLLVKHGVKVRCVLTQAAQRFITPLTFEAISGQPVGVDLFRPMGPSGMNHIALARWADVLLIAPATADLLAKCAHGIADDLLTTIVQARNGPVCFAPAMNRVMWENAATQRNVAAVKERGWLCIGPDYGDLACGEEGYGRMSAPSRLMEGIYRALSAPLLAGQRWVINAGATREYWDDVRFLTTAASGHLGSMLALVATARGAEIDLVVGPGVIHAPEGVQVHPVTSALEMRDTCLALASDADAFIATAAVGDFRFADRRTGKLKRPRDGKVTVELITNPDIVSQVARMPRRPRRVIAFAAERSQHVEKAKEKLKRKGCDAIVANDAAAMGSSTMRWWWIHQEGEYDLGEMAKAQAAERIVDFVSEMQPS